MAMAFWFKRPQNLYLKNEFINWADFLNADSDALIFGKIDILPFNFFECWESTVVRICILNNSKYQKEKTTTIF